MEEIVYSAYLDRCADVIYHLGDGLTDEIRLHPLQAMGCEIEVSKDFDLTSVSYYTQPCVKSFLMF